MNDTHIYLYLLGSEDENVVCHLQKLMSTSIPPFVHAWVSANALGHTHGGGGVREGDAAGLWRHSV